MPDQRDILIIAGSRTISPPVPLIERLIEGPPELVRCGCAEGVDRVGWAWARGRRIKVEYFPAWPSQMEWARSVALNHEKIHALPNTRTARAGMIRNSKMADGATRALLLRDSRLPVSRGTNNMRDCCIRENIPFILEDIKPDDYRGI